MGWFKQMSGSDATASGSDATAGVTGWDDTGINDSIYRTSKAIPSAIETRPPPLPGVPGPLRTDEIKRRQLALLERYVAKVRRR
jgi:hypothetical protein